MGKRREGFCDLFEEKQGIPPTTPLSQSVAIHTHLKVFFEQIGLKQFSKRFMHKISASEILSLGFLDASVFTANSCKT